MKTLHELAIKLQEFIIKQQQDSYNQSNLNVSKYNNLKLTMNSNYPYPHVIITIGISEAVYNFREGTKTEGSLGPDEKLVRKWISQSTTQDDLKELYISLQEKISAEEDETKAMIEEGESGEAKKDAPSRVRKTHNEIPMMDEEPGIEDAIDLETMEEEMQQHMMPSNINNKSSFNGMLKSFYKKQ